MSTRAEIPPIDNTMGAILIGVMVAGALWGVTCMQTYEYFNHYKKDPMVLKLLVTSVFCLDTLHQVFISHMIYTYLVTEYSDPAFLGVVVWSLLAQVIVSGLVALIVQSFFTWRIWRLSKSNIYLVVGIMCLVLSEFSLLLVYFIKGWKIVVFTNLPKLSGLSHAVNAVAAVGDVAIAGTLIVLLHYSKTGFKRSDKMVNRLILFSLNTGLLTSICAIASLISSTAAPNTFIYIGFYAPLCRLYTNSLLATLNARKALKSTGHSTAAISLERYDGSGSTPSSGNGYSKNAGTPHHLPMQIGGGRTTVSDDASSVPDKGVTPVGEETYYIANTK